MISRQLSGYTDRSSRSRLSGIEAIIVIFIMSFLFVGCNRSSTTSTPIPSNLPSSNQASTSSAAPSTAPTNTSQPASPSPTVVPLKIWLAPYLPEKMRSSSVLPAGYAFTDDPAEADASLIVGDQKQSPAIQWIYSLVAPFPTVTDGISSAELQAVWNGTAVGEIISSPLLMEAGTLDVLTAFWGAPAAGAVQVLPTGELLDHAWSNQPSWAIIPFEALEPRWKVLTLDGQSPVRKDFDPAAYPLSIPFSLSGKVSLQPGQIRLALIEP